MAESLQAYSDRMAKVIDNITADLKQNAADIQTTNKDRTADIHQLTNQVATINATISATISAAVHAAKVVGVTTGIVVTVLVGAGTLKVVFSDIDMHSAQKQLSDLSGQFDELKRTATAQFAETAKFVREAKIDQIDIALYSDGTVDQLQEPALRRIRGLANELKALNNKLSSDDQSNYFMLADVIEQFRGEHFREAKATLEKFTPEDHRHFGFSYMYGASLDRIGDPEEAYKWFQTARGFGDPIRVWMAHNAIAVANLTRWKSTKKEDFLADAKRDLVQLTEIAPQYIPAHFNLACAHAQDPKEYSNVTKELKTVLNLGGENLLVGMLQKDLTLQTDQFLSKYVKEELKIEMSANNPNFKSAAIQSLLIAAALP